MTAVQLALPLRADDLAAKNGELFRIRHEVLERFEEFSRGTRFVAREHFLCRPRVELEIRIQDCDDQPSPQKDPNP